MNERMEQEIRRTIRFLQASMPEPKNRQTSVFTLLRIAAGEINAGLLLGLFAGALIFGLLSVRALPMPMLTIFCTAPMPMLLLFHRYVLACDQRMRELEATFPYSYSEMLAARSVVISCCMFGALVLLSAMLHASVGEDFLRLALCGAVPGIYLCALLLFLSVASNTFFTSVFNFLHIREGTLAIAAPANQSQPHIRTLALVRIPAALYRWRRIWMRPQRRRVETRPPIFFLTVFHEIPP